MMSGSFLTTDGSFNSTKLRNLDQSVASIHQGLNGLVSDLPRFQRAVSQIDYLQTQHSVIQGSANALVPEILNKVEKIFATSIKESTRNIMVAS